MPTKPFTITADDKPVALKADGTGELTVNVTNATGKPLRALAKLAPLAETKKEWLAISGEPERVLAINGSDQFVVRMTVPAGTAPGKYSWRLNMQSVQDPDTIWAEGPVVSFVLAGAPPPPPPNGKNGKSWLWLILLGVILVGGGIVVALVLLPSHKVTVPDLLGLKLDAVTNKLQEAGLSVTNLTISLQEGGTNIPGTVLAQSPSEGTKMKPPVAVTVTVQKAPTLVHVPRVEGATLSSALTTLLQAGLTVATPVQVDTTNARLYTAQIVQKQDPLPDKEVKPNTPVTLTVWVQKVGFSRPWVVDSPALIRALPHLNLVTNRPTTIAVPPPTVKRPQ